MCTRRRKTTIEVLGRDARETGTLSAIQEDELMTDQGLETRNLVERVFLGCGHQYTGKEQGLVTCASCGDIWCKECSPRGGACDGCGRWLCPTHAKPSFWGVATCPECNPLSALSRQFGKGVLKWLDWS